MQYSDVLSIYRLFENNRGMSVNAYKDGLIDGRPFDQYYDLVNIEFEKMTQEVSYLVLDFGEFFYTMFASSFNSMNGRIVDIHSLDTTVSEGVGELGERYRDVTVSFAGFAGLELSRWSSDLGNFDRLDDVRDMLE